MRSPDASTLDESILEHRYADLEDVRLHYVEAGSGALVVLLHGFPEFWYAWRHQIPALVDAGFRVVAPDLRGYNLSDKPSGVWAYSLPRVVRDVDRLITACGEERAIVAGHDLGGSVAWLFAMWHPDRVRRLVVINAPHPARFQAALRSWRQLGRSSYILFFQLPWLPEFSLRVANSALLRWMFRHDPARPGTFSRREIDRYVEAARRPGALNAALNYYRATFRGMLGGWRWKIRAINAQVLVVWGEKDRYLDPALAKPESRWVPNVRVERLRDVGHWVLSEDPQRVNGRILDFLGDIRRADAVTSTAEGRR